LKKGTGTVEVHMGLKASRLGLAGHDDPATAALISRAAASDQSAWDELVERYAPLVWSICMGFRLDHRDVEDVAQNVWLLLAEQLGRLPEPAALPGWLARTTRRECRRVVTSAGGPDTVIGEEIVMAERNAVLRAAFAQLPPRCQSLIGMLTSDPPCSYAEISTTLGIPVESIAPQRACCLERMRESMALLGLAEAGANPPGGGPGA
jgi:RNA polymerase sigma factor (sigma-70 family)